MVVEDESSAFDPFFAERTHQDLIPARAVDSANWLTGQRAGGIGYA